MRATQANPNQRVQLELLRVLGLPEAQVGEIRDHLHRTGDDLALSGSGQVSLSRLASAAKAVASAFERAPQDGLRLVPFPAEALDRLLREVPGDTLRVGYSNDFPRAEVRASESVHHRSHLDAPVDLQVFGDRAEAVGTFVTKQAPELGRTLADGTATVRDLAPVLGTEAAQRHFGAALEKISAQLAQVGGPEHTARDLHVDLSSRYTHLDGGRARGEIGVYQQRSLQWFTAKRHKAAECATPADGVGFTVHGFERDSLVVTVPPGAKVLLLDKNGNQTGARLRPTTTEIDGEKHAAIQVTRSMVQRPGERYHTDPHFGLRVMDKSGDVLYERNFAFDKEESYTSTKIFSGTLATRPAPAEDLSELWDHYVPTHEGKVPNKTPVGERPRFTLDGAPEGDRVRIEKDGKTYDLHRLVQFLEPPRSAKQAFKIQGGFVELNYANTSKKTLDDSEYLPFASGGLNQGHRKFTFKRELSNTQQAHWGSRGVRVFGEGMRTVKGTFDPLFEGR